MKLYTLTQAIEKLESILSDSHTLTGIQFEDGSGHKFNIQTNGGKWGFIDLNDYECYLPR